MSERADAVRMRRIAKHLGFVQALRGADFSCAAERDPRRVPKTSGTRAAVGAMMVGAA